MRRRRKCKPHRLVLVPALGFFSILVCAVVAHGQGFGSTKKKIALHRKLPPAVHLTGTGINVKVSWHDPSQKDLAQQLHDTLETELLKNDKRLRPEAAHPDTLILCSITQYATPAPQTYTRNAPALNKSGGTPQQFNRVTGEIAVAYQAKDAAGRPLDSDNITAKYDEEFEAGTNNRTGRSIGSSLSDPFKRLAGKKTEEPNGPPTTIELQQRLLMKVVSQIASHLVQTDESVDVYLARGKSLDHENKMAENGLWSRYQEALEQMQPFPKKEDDAYRLYNIGVAYEALAYQAEDHKVARKFLDEAAINYGKAIEAKPDEKYFLEPQNRIETAMAHYKRLAELQAARQEPAAPPTASSNPAETTASRTTSSAAAAGAKQPAARPSKRSSSARSISPSAGTAAQAKSSPSSSAASKGSAGAGASPPTKEIRASNPPPLTNQQVIQLFKAGMDEENLIATIREAPTVQFDLSVDGQLQLVQNGVKGKVLSAMRERASKASSKHKVPAG